MGADMNFVASIKKGVRGWLKDLRDPPNLFQEPIWKVRVEFLVLTLLSPILIPAMSLRNAWVNGGDIAGCHPSFSYSTAKEGSS